VSVKSKSLVVLTLALLGALVFAGPVTAVPVTLSATLNGANEVNGGDPDGTGTAQITLDRSTREVCFDITASDIELPADAAHIHKGPAGQNGPIKVTLAPPEADGHSSGCVKAGRKLIKKITNNPSGFYVNVHTGEFPNGAIWGQLSS
jgi:hypothetical protein